MVEEKTWSSFQAFHRDAANFINATAGSADYKEAFRIFQSLLESCSAQELRNTYPHVALRRYEGNVNKTASGALLTDNIESGGSIFNKTPLPIGPHIW